MTIQKKVLAYLGMFFIGGVAVAGLSITADHISNAVVGSVVGGIPLLTSIMLWRAWLTNHSSRSAPTVFSRPYNLAVQASMCAMIYIVFAGLFALLYRLASGLPPISLGLPIPQWVFVPCWMIALILWGVLMACILFILIPFFRRNNILLNESSE